MIDEVPMLTENQGSIAVIDVYNYTIHCMPLSTDWQLTLYTCPDYNCLTGHGLLTP